MNLLIFNRESKLLRRLLLIIGLPVIVVILVVETVNYNIYTHEYLASIDLKQKEINDQIKTYYELQSRGLGLIEELMDGRLKLLCSQIVTAVDTAKNSQRLDLEYIRRILRMDQRNEDIYIINTNGVVVNTTFHDDFMLDFAKLGDKYFDFLEEVRKSKKFVSEKFSLEFSTHRIRKYCYQASHDGQYIIEIGSYSSRAEELVASFAGKINELTDHYSYLKEANLYIASDKPFSLYKNKVQSRQREEAVNDIFRKKTKEKTIVDAEDSHIKYQYEYFDEPNSMLYDGFVIEIALDQTAIEHHLLAQALFRILFTLVVSFLILYITFKQLMREVSAPLDKVNRTLGTLAKGDLDNADKFNFHKDDELEGIGNNLNDFVSQLKNTAKFAEEVGQGNWDAQYQLASSNDSIGLALLDMRNNLRKVEEEKKHREQTEADALWTTNGLNRFAEILRQNTDQLETFASNVISNLVKYIDVNQGALFFLTDEDEGGEKYLEQVASYAYGQSRKIKNRYSAEEGLLGACVSQKDTIYRTEIPKDYIFITSGLGDAHPRSLLIVPLKLNDEIFGAIELASFYEMRQVSIDFVEDIAESISYTLSVARNTVKMNKMAFEWQKQSQVYIESEQQLKAQILELKSEHETAALKIRALEDEKDTLAQNLDASLLQIKQLKERNKSSKI